MNLKNTLKTLFFLLFIVAFYNETLSSNTYHNISVVFINPGTYDDKNWNTAKKSMQKAANDFNIKFEVLESNGSHIKMIELTQKVIQRENKPDYLIFANIKAIGEKIISLTNKSGIKIFVLFEDFTDDNIHLKKQDNPNWIGSFTIDNQSTSEKITKNLINDILAHDYSKANIIAINGNRVTQSSVERKKGLETTINNESINARLNQLSYAEWNNQQAYIKTKVLLKRYPETNGIWVGGENMINGVLKAVTEVGLTPGKDIFIVCFDYNQKLSEYVKNKKITAIAGGHFYKAGFAITILFDDFYRYYCTENFCRFIFNPIIINAKNIENLQIQILNLDFKKQSKYYNKNIINYNFD